MPAIKQAYDISTSGYVELYLTWMSPGNQVDVAIYIHNVDADRKKEIQNVVFQRLPQYTQRTYQYQETDGDHPDVHTEYFEYTIEGPPQRVLAELVGGGGASRADAIAL